MEFAPNQRMAQRAALVAGQAHFTNLGCFDNIYFGEMPSGETLGHKVLFDFNKNIFRCSCPFSSKPCLHALAIALLANQSLSPAEGAPWSFPMADALPDWAEDLLNDQTKNIRKITNTPEKIVEAKQKRVYERLERADAGFDDLELWLLDTIRQGVAATVSADTKFYEGIAARIADASMTGVSRSLRLLGALNTATPNWAEATLAILTDCYLTLQTYRKRDLLPATLIQDLQARIGINIKKEEVLQTGTAVKDIFAVIGKREDVVEDRLNGRRTWVLSAHTGQIALFYDFAFGNTAFPPGFELGTIFQGEIVYYPSALPQRALLKEASLLPKLVEKLPGYHSFHDFVTAYAQAMGSHPWLSIFPATFNSVIPYCMNGAFYIKDAYSKSLPIAVREQGGWLLLALSGGHPIQVFGEWDGSVFIPLSALSQGKLVDMPGYKIVPKQWGDIGEDLTF